MATRKNNQQTVTDDVHAFLEKTLIEAYLRGKGYRLEDLKNMPPEKASQLMKEASTYASGKLAEMELKSHFVQELHDAYLGE